MSLMSGLYVGTSGLQTNQNALNVTAHNLSNVETKGYVRQQVLQADKFYNEIGNGVISAKQVGLGVNFDKVRQVRDVFLDASFRMETGRSAFYAVQCESTNEIETLLGEFNGVAFQKSLSDFWTSVQELEKDPSSAVVQGQLVNTASQFLDRATAVYNGLCSYQSNLNSRVIDYVKRINELGETIHDLNKIIKSEESNGVSEANDYRDQRNNCLDELAKYVNITATQNVDGGMEVLIEGAAFVTRDNYFPMGTKIDDDTGFVIPSWPHYEDQDVFMKHEAWEISTARNTNIGELKSLIYGRGDRSANFTDLEDPLFSMTKDDRLGIAPADKIPGTWMATETSVVMQVQAELDNLIHAITTEVNNILTGEKAAIDKYAETGNIDDLPLYTEDEFEKVPRELFMRLGSNRYEKVDIGGDTYYRYIPENTSNSHIDMSTMYTTSNLKINPELVKEPTKLGGGFVLDDKSVDQQKAQALVDAFNYKFDSLNPNLEQMHNFQDYYSAIVGQVASDGSVYNTIVMAQEAAARQLDDKRQYIMGVSSNEELTNMIMYQNAYNASSRYITAVNDMLESMMSTLF